MMPDALSRKPFGTKPPLMKLEGIQIIRALAANLVVVDHSLLTTKTAYPQLAWIMGAVGVWLFFVVSGLIMHHTTVHEVRGIESARLFLVRRVVRIVPLYWLFTFLLIIQAFFHGRFFKVEWIVKSLLFVPYIDAERQLHPIVQQGWTLNYEMLFYLIFAGSLLLSQRAGLIFIAAVLMALSIGTFLSLPIPFSAWTDPVVLLFGVGIAVSMIRPTITLPEGLGSHLVALACLGAVVTVFLFWLAPTYPPSLTAHVLAWLACAIVILLAASARVRPSWFSRLLELLGNASYSTYLCHNIVINPVYRHVSSQLGPFLSILVMVIAANIIGILLYRFFETPLNKCLRGLTSAKHKTSPQVIRTA